MKYTTDKHDNEVSFDDLCQLIYKGFGQDAVLGFCDSIGHETWLVCDACEIESPITDSPDAEPTCLVCGSVV
jgi:hypothetical protein